MITDKDISMKHIKEAMKLIENLTGNGKRSSERVFSDFFDFVCLFVQQLF